MSVELWPKCFFNRLKYSKQNGFQELTVCYFNNESSFHFQFMLSLHSLHSNSFFLLFWANLNSVLTVSMTCSDNRLTDSDLKQFEKCHFGHSFKLNLCNLELSLQERLFFSCFLNSPTQTEFHVQIRTFIIKNFYFAIFW